MLNSFSSYIDLEHLSIHISKYSKHEYFILLVQSHKLKVKLYITDTSRLMQNNE